MLYLIKNIYFRNNYYHYELINNNLDVKTVKRLTKLFDVGCFVNAEYVDQKLVISETEADKPSDFLSYYEHGKLNQDELKIGIAKYINQINKPNFIKILDETINKSENFYQYPAAKNIHHAYIGGLAEHTLNILKLSDTYIEQYDLDRQLLYMGILLHDYAKIYELTDHGLNYSLEGNLIGHLVMCVEEISFISKMNNIEKELDILYLKHMILSHHGKLEYGSPKEPMFIEAYVLSMLDEADAKINTLYKELNDVEKNKLSHPINAMDRKRFIKIK